MPNALWLSPSRGSSLLLRVRDDGTGLPAPAHELDGGGIRGLRERALTIDARLEVQAAAEGGTEVLLWVPADARGLVEH